MGSILWTSSSNAAVFKNNVIKNCEALTTGTFMLGPNGKGFSIEGGSMTNNKALKGSVVHTYEVSAADSITLKDVTITSPGAEKIGAIEEGAWQAVLWPVAARLHGSTYLLLERMQGEGPSPAEAHDHVRLEPGDLVLRHFVRGKHRLLERSYQQLLAHEEQSDQPAHEPSPEQRRAVRLAKLGQIDGPLVCLHVEVAMPGDDFGHDDTDEEGEVKPRGLECGDEG